MDNFLESYEDGMHVAYELLVGNQVLEEIIYYLDGVILPFDPTGEMVEEEDLDHMISYFEGKEDYEKCFILKKFKEQLEIEYI
jgi:hypothetical protein|tara:strand:+ start:2838 stop:3086 length:249 start_codon:yes stop_codon:yes gene_type:complete